MGKTENKQINIFLRWWQETPKTNQGREVENDLDCIPDDQERTFYGSYICPGLELGSS